MVKCLIPAKLFFAFTRYLPVTSKFSERTNWSDLVTKSQCVAMPLFLWCFIVLIFCNRIILFIHGAFLFFPFLDWLVRSGNCSKGNVAFWHPKLSRTFPHNHMILGQRNWPTCSQRPLNFLLFVLFRNAQNSKTSHKDAWLACLVTFCPHHALDIKNCQALSDLGLIASIDAKPASTTPSCKQRSMSWYCLLPP